MTTDFGSDLGGGIREPPPGNRNNRLFIILALGLAGLLVLGLMGIGTVIALLRLRSAQEVVLATATPTVAFQLSATPTVTPIPPTSTHTPVPTPTNTPVVPAGTTISTPAATVIPMASPTSEGEMPGTGGVLSPGSTSNLTWLGLGLLLLLVSGAVHRLRRPPID